MYWGFACFCHICFIFKPNNIKFAGCNDLLLLTVQLKFYEIWLIIIHLIWKVENQEIRPFFFDELFKEH